MDMDAEATRATVHRVLAALDAADWAALEEHPGLYETRQYFPLLKAAFPDLRHHVEAEWVDATGDTISCVASAEATHRGPYLGIPASGQCVRFMVLLIARVAEGRIIQYWALPDFLSLVQQIGAAVAPASPASPVASVPTPQPSNGH
jgi:predicted ester cyclase